MQWPLPESDLYTLENVPGAGRSVIAKCPIKAGTPLLSTSPSMSPVAHTIFRVYRREVCAWCFFYDRGRTLGHRDLLVSAGVVFCSQTCAATWKDHAGSLGLKAYQELELRDRRSSKAKPAAARAASVDSEEQSRIPSKQDILDMLETFHIFGENAKRARLGKPSVRDKKKTLQTLSTERGGLDPDNLRLLLSGILYDYHLYTSGAPQEVSTDREAAELAEKLATTSLESEDTEHNGRPVPPSLLALEGDSGVYKTRDALTDNMSGYVELLAHLPTELLPFASPFLCHEILSRASHNAFSIRPVGVTDGDQSGEYFGWGVWPEASFFNHSCAPTVAKVRNGRIWNFTAARDIKQGEHLCITYLGGDEQDLDVQERRARLREHWHFMCQCGRCMHEAGIANAQASA